MFVLQLNLMTVNAERVVPVAYAETREQLEAYLQDNLVEPYADGQWQKVFRRGSDLEWYNPPVNGQAFINVPMIVDVGTEYDWADEGRRRYQAFLNEISVRL